jgi:hypothetical protein
MAATSAADPQLVPGRTYTWEELGALFGFEPSYLGVAGGMIPRPDVDALLLITWPGGARSFNYEDYWEGRDLIYTGRGKVGDQRLEGANRDLAENRRTNYVFEGGAGSRMLHFLGTAVATRQWRARGVGDDGRDREILRYRLEFQTGGPSAGQRAQASTGRSGPGRTTRRASAAAEPHRERRPFDPSRTPGQYGAPVQRATPEETAARREKANGDHHALLVRLQTELQGEGWTDLNEIPSAIDLEGVKGQTKVLFEAKTVSGRSELSQTRAGLSQLLEYRFFYGAPSDELCLVTDSPISDRRIRFLEGQGIAVAYEDGNGLVACGKLAQKLLT